MEGLWSINDLRFFDMYPSIVVFYAQKTRANTRKERVLCVPRNVLFFDKIADKNFRLYLSKIKTYLIRIETPFFKGGVLHLYKSRTSM